MTMQCLNDMVKDQMENSRKATDLQTNLSHQLIETLMTLVLNISFIVEL